MKQSGSVAQLIRGDRQTGGQVGARDICMPSAGITWLVNNYGLFCASVGIYVEDHAVTTFVPQRLVFLKRKKKLQVHPGIGVARQKMKGFFSFGCFRHIGLCDRSLPFSQNCVVFE